VDQKISGFGPLAHFIDFLDMNLRH